jgi:hypothetical protein
MTSKLHLTTAVATSFAAFMLLTSPSSAATEKPSTSSANETIVAHVAQGQHQGGMNKDMGGGMMKEGAKHGHMMHKRMMDGGMMHGGSKSGMHGGMMHGGSKSGMHGGMMQGKHGGHGMRVVPMKHLTVEDTRHFFEHHLEKMGHKRLKVGTVKELGADSIVAEIVTVDDSLVQRFKVDRHSGAVQKID